MSDNTCVICGDIIPEGRQVCPVCEMKNAAKIRQDNKKRKKSEYNRKYNRENMIQKLLTFNRKNPDEMILYNYLTGKENINGYIKNLIWKDMIIQKERDRLTLF